MPNFISVSHFTHILTHTNMAWKSVMSSTSHHALFLCSEVSEANGNSSFPPSAPTLTFILSFLLSFSPHPPPLYCRAALICIEEEPPHMLLNFLPSSFLFTPTSFFLLFSFSFHLCSLPTCIFCLISSIFHLFRTGYFLFPPGDPQQSPVILPISPAHSLPATAIHCTNQSIAISCIPSLLSSILSWFRNKAGSHYPPPPPPPPLQPYPPTHLPFSFRLGLAG